MSAGSEDGNGKQWREVAVRLSGISSDSREVQAGYLFAAIAGARADGALFIKDAVERGAAAVMAAPHEAELVRGLGVEFLAAENPRLALAHLAAAFFTPQPEHIAAVTGTNGKTSVTVFLREIWTALGHASASLGTIGAISPSGSRKLANTTPGPVELHRIIADLAQEGVTHLAMEASSHGLDQYRLDGVAVRAAAFTNLTRDHLDYHATFEAYLAAKLRLFAEILPSDGVAVVNADDPHGEDFAAAAARRGARVLRVGLNGGDIRIRSRVPAPGGQRVCIAFDGKDYDVALPLAGAFQASNALVAAAQAIGLGEDPAAVFAAMEGLRGAPGRMEKVAVAGCGAPIYVDYAHTPDALKVVLTAMRPHASRRLVVVFGCGGDRDKGKRPMMGKIAAELADAVIVTDDNPRTEDAAVIRREVLAGCPGAQEIGNRADAIRAAVDGLGEGDVLVIAGKGHESGQIVGSEVYPFSDRDEAVKAVVVAGGNGVGGVV